MIRPQIELYKKNYYFYCRSETRDKLLSYIESLERQLLGLKGQPAVEADACNCGFRKSVEYKLGSTCLQCGKKIRTA